MGNISAPLIYRLFKLLYRGAYVEDICSHFSHSTLPHSTQSIPLGIDSDCEINLALPFPFASKFPF